MLVFAWFSDLIFRGARWPPILFAGIVNIITYVSLAVWDIQEGWRWTCFILVGCGTEVSGLCMAWADEICSDDNEEQAVMIASMNEMAYVFQAWIPLLVWQQVDAPEYLKGYIFVTSLSAGMIAMAFIIRNLEKRN
jgi:ACS family pantothenate transporter-like MFS transporter